MLAISSNSGLMKNKFKIIDMPSYQYMNSKIYPNNFAPNCQSLNENSYFSLISKTNQIKNKNKEIDKNKSKIQICHRLSIHQRQEHFHRHQPLPRDLTLRRPSELSYIPTIA